MKILYVLILFFLFKSQVSKSQDFICGMPPPTMDQLNDQPMLRKKLGITNSSSLQNNLTVNVVFHISNNLITFEKTTEMMNVLNSAFEDHNISFNRLCVNFSGSSELIPYAINIGVANLASSGVAGYAGGYGSNYLVIHYGNATSSTSLLVFVSYT